MQIIKNIRSGLVGDWGSSPSSFEIKPGEYSFEAGTRGYTGDVGFWYRNAIFSFSKHSSWDIKADFKITTSGRVYFSTLDIEFKHEKPLSWDFDDKHDIYITDSRARIQSLGKKDLSAASLNGQFLTLEFKGKFPIHKAVIDLEEESVFFDGSVFFNWNRGDRKVEGALTEMAENNTSYQSAGASEDVYVEPCAEEVETILPLDDVSL